MKDKQNSKAPCTWAPLPAEGCGAAFPDPSKELSLKPRPPLPRKKISYASRWDQPERCSATVQVSPTPDAGLGLSACKVESELQNISALGQFSGKGPGIPRGTRRKEPACRCRRCKRCVFNPWVGKNPWRRKWQHTPVLSPGESHGQRNLAGYCPTRLKWLSTSAHVGRGLRLPEWYYEVCELNKMPACWALGKFSFQNAFIILTLNFRFFTQKQYIYSSFWSLASGIVTEFLSATVNCFQGRNDT